MVPEFSYLVAKNNELFTYIKVCCALGLDDDDDDVIGGGG